MASIPPLFAVDITNGVKHMIDMSLFVIIVNTAANMKIYKNNLDAYGSDFFAVCFGT